MLLGPRCPHSRHGHEVLELHSDEWARGFGSDVPIWRDIATVLALPTLGHFCQKTSVSSISGEDARRALGTFVNSCPSWRPVMKHTGKDKAPH